MNGFRLSRVVQHAASCHVLMRMVNVLIFFVGDPSAGRRKM